jgi:glutamine amidotransferase
MKIAILDYSVGNVASLLKSLSAIGVEAKLTRDSQELNSASGLILPGVGNYEVALQNLHNSGLSSVLNHIVLEKKVWVLGICLGLQIMTKGSEEGTLPGLGWLSCRTKKLPVTQSKKIPNIGWNTVRANPDIPLSRNFTGNSRFYFAHSFAVVDAPEEIVMFKSNHGIDFVAGLASENIFGVQFHPEKSYGHGEQLLKNFVSLVCAKD